MILFRYKKKSFPEKVTFEVNLPMKACFVI